MIALRLGEKIGGASIYTLYLQQRGTQAAGI